MDEILEYSLNILKNIDDEITSKQDEYSKIDEYISILNALKENPDSMDEEVLKQIFNEEERNKEEYDAMILYKGYYASHKKQSQIKSLIEYLNNIVNEKINEFNLKKEQIISKVNELKQSKQKYINVQELLENYNENVYITEEDLSILDEILSNITASDKVLKFYFKIARNNSKIEKEQAKLESDILSQSELEQIEQTASEFDKNITEDKKKTVNIEEKKKEYLNKYKNFLSNLDYVRLNEEAYNIAYRILLNVKPMFELINNGEFDDAIIVEDAYEYIDAYGENKTLLLATCMALLNAYEENDINKVLDVISLYKANNTVPLDEYLYLEGYADYSDTLIKIDDYLSFEQEENYNYIRSCQGCTEEEKKEYLKNNKIPIEDQYKYYLVETYKDLQEILKERNINSDENKKQIVKEKIGLLDEFYKELETIETEKQKQKEEAEARKTKTNQKRGRTVPPEDIKNYFVFLNPEEFEKGYEETKQKHGDVKAGHLVDVFKSILYTDINDLFTGSHVIMYDGKQNPYNIKEFKKGVLRYGFKQIGNAGIEKKPVILMILPCYGSLGTNEKNAYLSKNVKLYSDMKEEYERIKDILSKDNNSEGPTPEAKKLLAESQRVCERIYKASKEESNEMNPRLGGKDDE